MVEKKNLERLLQLLPALLEAKGNEWFKDELRKLVTANTIHAYSESSKEYLIINPGVLLLDYSAIPDEKVRTQLTVDCYEMARHRFGRVNHKPDFDEFCRYAHMQIEELINYYYEKKFSGNLYQIISDIIATNPIASGKINSCKNLSTIGFIYKAWAITNKLFISSDMQNTILRVCYLRNELSHRTSLSKITSEDKLEQYQRKRGPIDDISLITDDSIKTILFRNSKNWEGVYSTIGLLRNKIIDAI